MSDHGSSGCWRCTGMTHPDAADSLANGMCTPVAGSTEPDPLEAREGGMIGRMGVHAHCLGVSVGSAHLGGKQAGAST